MPSVTRSVLLRRKTRVSFAHSKGLLVAALCERKLRVLITTPPHPHARNGEEEKGALPGPGKSSHDCPELQIMGAVMHPAAVADIHPAVFRRRTFVRGEGLIEGIGDKWARREGNPKVSDRWRKL